MYSEYIDNIELLEESIRQYEDNLKCAADIHREMEEIEGLRQALYDKYHNKFQYINEEEVREYSPQELDEIKRELLDNSFLTIIKRFLGIGKRQDIIYAELMGKIKGLTLYLQGQMDEWQNQMENAYLGIQTYGNNILEDYHKVMVSAGYEEASDWEKYEPSDKEENELYLGDIDVFLEEERVHCEDLVAETLGECYKDEFIKIPYTLESRKPFQMFCEYDGEQLRAAANGLARSLIYQQMRQMKEYAVEFHIIDGENTGNDLSELLGLKQIRENEVWQLNKKVTGNVYKYAQIYLNNQDISQGLKALDQYIGYVAEETSGFQSVEEYNASPRCQEKGMIPLQMVVVQNFPSGFSENDVELLNKLIRNGNQRGVSVLIMYDSKNRGFFKEKVDDPTANLLDGITLEAGNAHLMARDCSSAIELRIMKEGKREYVQSLIDEKMKVKETDNRFSALLDVNGPFGEKKTSEGIHIPFAVDKRGEIKEFTLANAMNAHGLISGGTGSGKSTLIHMIISSVAMNYTPDDVEMWLVDYKINEFSSYKYNTPPHIKFLGLSKGIDFTFALLDRIWEEYERRQQIIKQADEDMKKQGEGINITSINDYRNYFGQESMSRLLIIIDEFHVMAQQVNEDYQYKDRLENLLAEGRAAGITFLFSDQTVTVGLKGLTDKGKKQIKCRLALANDMEEMREMLQNNDKEALRPFMTMKMGECALITYENVRGDDGHMEEYQKIERVKNIYIDGETRFELCRNIRKFYHVEDYLPVYMDETEKKYFSESVIHQWEKKNMKRMDYSRQIPLYLGEALDLTGCFPVLLLHRRGENIMSVGGMEEEQKSLLLSQIRSMQRVPEHKIVVLADSYSRLFDMCEDDLLDLQDEDQGIEIYSHMEDICRQINILLSQANDRKRENRTLVIWIGLEDIYEEFKNYSDKKPACFSNITEKSGKKENADASASALDDKWALLFGEDPEEKEEQEDEVQEEDEDEEIYNAIEDVVNLLHSGPRNGIFNYVIYDTTYPIRNNRMIKVDDFRHKLAFSMGKDECGEFLGRTNLLDGMEKQNGVAAYYDGKGKIKKFVPYQI